MCIRDRPKATLTNLGELALADLTRLTGSPCASKPGLEAAKALARRLSATAPATVVFLRDGMTNPLAPVSYTHLDVYKRQRLRNINGWKARACGANTPKRNCAKWWWACAKRR